MNQDRKADFILRSGSIFTATEEGPTSGFVAVAGDRVLAAGKGDGAPYRGPGTAVHELGNRTVCPGFIDVHCFFGGYAMGRAGVDLGAARSAVEAVELAVAAARDADPRKAVLGRGLRAGEQDEEAQRRLEAAFPDRPAVLFHSGGETCLMNEAARGKYRFTPDTCYPEAYWRLLAEVLSDRAFIVPEFQGYMRMLNGRGITGIKEMGFDDYYGFADTLAEMDENGLLTLRLSFMSQPVGRSLDLGYAIEQRDRFNAANGLARFSGFNRMTDGSISQLCGDLKRPYACAPDLLCGMRIDYAAIEREVLEADAGGFRFSLHAQGDAAIAKALDILEKCRRDERGRLVNRHAVTDVEFSDPRDLERMGRLGAIAEIYPQIMSLASRGEKTAMIDKKIGPERGRFYWNRRKMADSGVTISCGTDLPLLIPDIPESIYHSCGGFFPEGGEPFNAGNVLSVTELLKAWTANGAYNLYREAECGTIEKGKKADLVIFNDDVFATPIEKVRNMVIEKTYLDGIIVYQKT